ncbi:DUF6233 domain-containing protein [Streptomyces sp. NPDC003710]
MPALSDRWSADEERHQAERGQSEHRRPPQRDRLTRYGLSKANIGPVHTVGCWAAGKSGHSRPATRRQALDALRQLVPDCVHCRPDTALGILE